MEERQKKQTLETVTDAKKQSPYTAEKFTTTTRDE